MKKATVQAARERHEAERAVERQQMLLEKENEKEAASRRVRDRQESDLKEQVEQRERVLLEERRSKYNSKAAEKKTNAQVEAAVREYQQRVIGDLVSNDIVSAEQLSRLVRMFKICDTKACASSAATTG